jgi:hypothetical protein
MADEITLSFQMNLVNGSLKSSHSSGSLTIDQTTAKLVSNVQTIGTVEEALDLGDITTPGIGIFVNLDSTNFIELGLSGQMFVRINAGEQYPFRVTTTAPYAKADTANVELFYILLED